MSEELPRGVAATYWNNLNPGWQMECLCGYVSRESCEDLTDAAWILQDHWVWDH